MRNAHATHCYEASYALCVSRKALNSARVCARRGVTTHDGDDGHDATVVENLTWF
jgi:hypothetical protein